MILFEGISTRLGIRNGESTICAGGKVANALTIAASLENNTLQRLAGVLVDLLDGNIFLQLVRNGEEGRILRIILNGEHFSVQHILRVGDDLLRLISTRFRIRQPDTAGRVRGVVAEQLAVAVDGKGHALDRSVSFVINFINSEMRLECVGKSQGRNFCLIFYQLDSLFRRVHVVMLGIAAGFLNAVSTRLEIFNHRFAVLVGRYRSQMCIIVINIKLPAGQRNLGFLVDFHNTDG